MRSRRSPASVGETLRVVRVRSRTPSRASSSTDGLAERRLRNAQLRRGFRETALRATARKARRSSRCRAAFIAPAYKSMQIIAASRRQIHALNPAQAARRARQHVAKRKRHSKTNEAPRAVISHCGCCGQSLRRRDDHAPTHARRLWRPRRNGSSQTRRRGDGDPACPDNTKERSNGDQTKRLTAVRQGTGGLFHRRGPHRSAVRGARSGACPWRQRHLRAGRPHRMAHASARPDIDRHLRLRLGAAWGGPVEEIRPGDVVWFRPARSIGMARRQRRP